MTHYCPHTPPVAEFCYVMVRGDLAKIGISHNPERRRRDLEREHGQPVRLVIAVAGNRATEHLLHVAFTGQALGHEWFHATGPLAALIDHYDRHCLVPGPSIPVAGVVTPDMI